ncbi:deoxyribodipyrimidine photo-lyase, partial [Acinetobacter baumannii]
LDRDILDPLPRADRRVEFILGALQVLDEDLRRHGGALIVRHGRAVDEIPRLAAELGVQAVFCNHDDEPQALARDAQVAGGLARLGARLL